MFYISKDSDEERYGIGYIGDMSKVDNMHHIRVAFPLFGDRYVEVYITFNKLFSKPMDDALSPAFIICVLDNKS